MVIMVRAGGLAGYVEFCRSLELDPIAMLEEAGLTEQDISDPNNYVPYTKLLEAMELPASKYGVTDFGLRYTSFQDTEFLGALSVVINQAESLYESITLTSKYMSFHTNGATLNLSESDDGQEFTAAFNLHVQPRLYPSQVVERSVGYLARIAKAYNGQASPIKAVSFIHSRAAPLALYQKFFGLMPEFDGPFNGVILDLPDIKKKTRDTNREVRRLAEDFLLSQNNPNPPSTTDQAREVLRRLMPFRAVSVDELATTLNLHKRTLQRELKSDGQTFGRLRDGIRQELARNYLMQGQIPLSQVAELLGFADQSVLTRACHKWFGRTPQNVRNDLQAPGQ